MFRNSLILIFGFLLLVTSCQKVTEQTSLNTKDLTTLWDTITPLANPHKGWYHHLLDNGVDTYEIKDRALFSNFPGMDHLYIRIAWSYLEPKEGAYDWSRIDKIIEEYVPKGYGIAFRITSKETGTYPGTVGEEVAGTQYATPKWVKDAGAKGIVAEMWDVKSWVPVWDDPIYLEKLDKFHQAFAARYDGKPYVRYIDVGSIGEWGEGHTSFSTKVPPTVEEVKANMDVYLKHYKKSLLVVTDDLLYYGKNEEQANELLKYALDNGFTLRDDSPLVDWYIQQNFETYSVSHPHFFKDVYKNKPVIFELQHYHMVKNDGNWLGRNGDQTIPGKNISGADLFKGALKTTHATYIGYHGYLEEWYKDNPKLTDELLNSCGYWFFPKSATFVSEINHSQPLEFSIEWLNKGVAPAYHPYKLIAKLEGKNRAIHFDLNNADPQSWLPGKSVSETYKIDLPTDILPGQYHLKLKLTTSEAETKRTVLLGLKDQIKDSEGFYSLFTIDVKEEE